MTEPVVARIRLEVAEAVAEKFARLQVVVVALVRARFHAKEMQKYISVTLGLSAAVPAWTS